MSVPRCPVWDTQSASLPHLESSASQPTPCGADVLFDATKGTKMSLKNVYTRTFTGSFCFLLATINIKMLVGTLLG